MTNNVAMVKGLTWAGQQLGYCCVLAMRIARPLKLLATKSS